MGVPAFFKWLKDKYETSVSSVFPTGQFENLYLDMNAIIHPCTHPEDGKAPETEEEMFQKIFEYVDIVYNLIMPNRLVYIAVDGVAPRAKMNQQRSRRFKAAKDSKDIRIRKDLAIQKLKARGLPVPEQKESFDPNCITPGTKFMARFCAALKIFVEEKNWDGKTVIVSDSSVPGEGEHKIMDFIRKQKFRIGYDIETRHVLVGADADLIMLGLASHEKNFFILREEHRNKILKCEICGDENHPMEHCFGIPVENNPSPPPKFSLVNLQILRNLLAQSFDIDNFDRALDDWIFLCFLVGNDFLPNLPGLEIREGALDKLFEIYKECLAEGSEWFTDSGKIYFPSFKILCEKLISKIKKTAPGYYKKKFGKDDSEFRKSVAFEYLKGLNWVLLYYFQGCPSWDWYYPYHYAPMALDLSKLSDYDFEFDSGDPIKPFDQLLSVFPTASKSHLPKLYSDLMSTKLCKYYPENFSTDLNGKKYAWQAIVILPFVDQKILLSETFKLESLLDKDEKERNSRGREYIRLGDWIPKGTIDENGNFSNPKFPTGFVFKSSV